MNHLAQSNLRLFIATFIFALSGCGLVSDVKDLDDVNLSPDLAFPIVNTNVSAADIITKFDADGTNTNVNGNGLISLVYSGQVASQSASDLIELPSFPIPLIDTLQTAPYALSNGGSLNTVIFKEGVLAYEISADLPEDIEVMIRIPNASIGGDMFEERIDLYYQSGGFVSGSGSIDVSGYTLDLTDNELTLSYSAIRKNTGETISLRPDSYVVLQDAEFSYIEGFLGEYQLDSGEDRIGVDIFKTITFASVYFDNPRIDVTVRNSFGIPARTRFETLDAISEDGSITPIQSPLSSFVSLNYPELDEVGMAAETMIAANNGNSNINEVINAAPHEILYQLVTDLNPDGVAASNFATDNSVFEVDIDVELPLYGRVLDVAVIDTFPVDFREFNTVEDVEFLVHSENGLPIELGLQVYFVENGQVVDSLLLEEQSLMVAAETDASGWAVTPSEQDLIVTFDATRFGQIKGVSEIYLKTRFSTSNQGLESVRLRDTDAFDVRVGMKGKFDISVTDLIGG